MDASVRTPEGQRPFSLQSAGGQTGPSRVPARRFHVPRIPVGPYLVAGDVIALLVVALVTPSDPSDVAAMPALLLSLHLSGLYRSRLTLSLLDDLPDLTRGIVALLFVSMALHVLTTSDNHNGPWYLLLALPLLCVIRFAAYCVVRMARRQGYVHHRAVIIGAGRVGIALVHNLNTRPEYGIEVVGLVDDNPRVTDPADLPAPLLGGYNDIAEIIREHDARQVIVAFGTMREVQLVEILRTCDRLACEIFFVPRLFEIHATTRDMDEIWGVPLVRIRRAPFRKFAWRVKRSFDVGISLVSLILLSPLLAACALAVRLEGGPGVLFRQERVGLDERPFTLLKFRSIKPSDEKESATRWNVADEARIGPVGRFLRRTSLDELPQLWNVLVGDMSLVGPRPERPFFVKRFRHHIPRYLSRHRVPAGMTGQAQVHGLRGDTSVAERAAFDNYYIENWSLWGDVKIMVRTVGQVFRQSGG